MEFVAVVATALLSGAPADSVDRRRTARLTELDLLACPRVLLLNARLPDPRVVVLYVVAALATALDALQRPGLHTLLPGLRRYDACDHALPVTPPRG